MILIVKTQRKVLITVLTFVHITVDNISFYFDSLAILVKLSMAILTNLHYLWVDYAQFKKQAMKNKTKSHCYKSSYLHWLCNRAMRCLLV